MNLFGNAIRNWYGTLTILTPAGGSVSILNGMQIGAPAGGDKGAGTINVSGGLFVNGTAVLTGAAVTSITGTANQIAASASTGAVTLSMPQNVIIPTPSSGNALAVNGVAGSSAGIFNGAVTTSQSFGLQSNAGTNTSDFSFLVANQAASITYFKVLGDGSIVTGTNASQGIGTINAAAFFAAGNPIYAGIPQNLQAGSYTFVLSDANKHILTQGVNVTMTIPANASVAYPVGTAITIASASTGVVTIAITTDTLIWSNNGAAGSRSLAFRGTATILKVSSNTWYISGSGLT